MNRSISTASLFPEPPQPTQTMITVFRKPAFVFLLMMSAGISGASIGYSDGSDDVKDQKALIQRLSSDETSKADKAMTCKKLAIYGDDECVDTVAKFLTDPELTSWARTTLESIGTPKAQSALIAAIDETEGLPLVGILNSLGVLQSPAAVQPLSKIVKVVIEGDSLPAETAAVSLGKIGGEEAESALALALNDSRDAVRSAAAEGLILAAESKFNTGQNEAATNLYDAVLIADVPQPRIIEATLGAILSRRTEGVAMIIDKLGSDNERIRFAALTSARRIQGDGIVAALIEGIDRVPTQTKSLYLIALGDREDDAFIQPMIAAIASESTDVRLAAIGVLQKIGGPSSVDALIAAANDDVTPVAEAARNTLARLDDPAIDEAIANRLKASKGDARVALIGLVGSRRIDAVDYLVTAADDADPAVREAALAALGQVATLEQLPLLIARATKSKSVPDAEAMKALRAACVRQADRAAVAQILSGAMDRSAPATQVALLETVAAMGGPDALAVLGDVATNGTLPMKDAATRLLGNWMSVDAGAVLAEVAKQKSNPYRIRAARGFLRLVRQFVMTPAERHDMMNAAMGFVDRNEEKQLMLEAAARYPSGSMLKSVVDISAEPSLAEQSKSTGLSIARKINGNQAVANLLKKLGVENVDLEIVEAKYGAGDQQKDVTETLRSAAGDFPMVVLDPPAFNAAFGGDAAPGLPKFLSVKYKVNGKEASAMIREDMSIILDSVE